MNSPTSRQDSGDICFRYCLKSGTKKTVKAIASLTASIGMAIFVTSLIFLLIPGKQIKNPLSPARTPAGMIEKLDDKQIYSLPVFGSNLSI
jgi:hypothetical protein